MTTLFDDDPGALPPHLREVYHNPHKFLGLDPEETTTKSIRDAFRRAALGYCSYFWGLAKPKASMEVILFAYHLLRRNIVGPAQDINAGWHNNPYMDFRPEDLVPTLKPLQGQVDIPRVYRGFRNLNIKFLKIETSFDILAPKFKFSFSVHYCMRRHTIEKTLDELKSFYADVRNELLCIPEFPSQLQGISYVSDLIYGLGLTSRDEMGHSLAKFIQRIHDTLSSSGNFSPRVFRFLKIDYERVQSEEEGAIMAVLDSATLPPSSCWYMIDEVWLKKWRSFAMGRGPRRYLAPGPVKNDDLKREALLPGKKWLEKVVNYRAVNCNVWSYYIIVHGGGPIISRKLANIYSPFAVSYLQGVIAVQSKIRGYLAKKKLDYLYMERFSKSRAAKFLLTAELLHENQAAANALIHEESVRRLNVDMIAAAQLTQALWRKINSSIPEEKLKMALQDEKVFVRARQMQSTSEATSKSVVKEVHAVVRIGGTGLYTRTISDVHEGIPFKIRKLPWSEEAIIAEAIDDNYEKNSKLVAINGYPTLGMKYEQVKNMLGNSTRPLELKFQRPPPDGHEMFLDELLTLNDPDLQYQSFKLLLSRRFYLIRHTYSDKTRQVLDSVGLAIIPTSLHKPFICGMILSDTHLHIQKRFDVSKLESELWQTINLYDINHIKTGHEIDMLKNQSKIDKDHTFAIVMNSGRNLIFEIPYEENKEKYLLEIDAQKLKLLEDRKQSLLMQGEHVEEEGETEKQVEDRQRGISVRAHLSKRRRAAAKNLHNKDGVLAELATAGGNPYAGHDQRKKVKSESGFFSYFKRKKADDEFDADSHLYHNAKAGIFIAMMKRLRNEIQDSQQYIDLDGVPVIRRSAKSSLRKVAK